MDPAQQPADDGVNTPTPPQQPTSSPDAPSQPAPADPTTAQNQADASAAAEADGADAEADASGEADEEVPAAAAVEEQTPQQEAPATGEAGEPNELNGKDNTADPAAAAPAVKTEPGAAEPAATEPAAVKTEPDTASAGAGTPADTPMDTPPASKTAPLQPAKQKAEAKEQVDAFLSQIQQQHAAAAATSSSAAEATKRSDSPSHDLSTPAGRRAHLFGRVEAERRDSEAWLALLADCEARLAEGDASWDIEQLRATYERFFEIYPTAARQWLAYIDLELSLSNFKRVEELFTRCLRTTPSVSLWSSYLSYTRRVNPLPPPSGGAGAGDDEGERGRVRKLIEDAYDFATRHVGMSRDAGDVWVEYIRFVKERDARTPWLSGQKMDDLRRIYQRVVGIPVANVETLWREYDQFENGLNRVTAKKFLAERSAAYMTARSSLKEMRQLVDPLHRPLLPRLPAWVASTSPAPGDVARDRERLEGWKRYLQWEQADPLELADVDRDALKKRVDVAYAKATMHMRFYSEIWWMASKWAEQCGKPDEAERWLRDGMKACPER